MISPSIREISLTDCSTVSCFFKLCKDISRFLRREILSLKSGEIIEMSIGGAVLIKTKGKWAYSSKASKDRMYSVDALGSFLLDLEYSKFSKFIFSDINKIRGTLIADLRLRSADGRQETIEIYEYSGDSSKLLVKSGSYDYFGVTTRELFSPVVDARSVDR